jgi:DNA-binding MarR family transcriptional regulator
MTQIEIDAGTRADLTQLLARTEHTVMRRIERTLDQGGVTLDQWRVLSLLSDGAGHPMTEVAGYAMVPPPTLTKIVDRLVERNLVYRRVDDTDRRRVLVFLAARGRELHRKLLAKVELEEAAIVALLGPRDADRIAELLTRLLRLLGD